LYGELLNRQTYIVTPPQLLAGIYRVFLEKSREIVTEIAPNKLNIQANHSRHTIVSLINQEKESLVPSVVDELKGKAVVVGILLLRVILDRKGVVTGHETLAERFPS